MAKQSKICTTCKKEKLSSEFSKSPISKDGLQYKCKNCTAKYQQYYKTSGMKKINYTKYNKTEKGKEVRRKTRTNYKKHNPEKHRCRWIVWNGLKLKSINRPTICDKCSKYCVPDAHHENYSKPLEIIWLCKQCHFEIHCMFLLECK